MSPLEAWEEGLCNRLTDNLEDGTDQGLAGNNSRQRCHNEHGPEHTLCRQSPPKHLHGHGNLKVSCLKVSLICDLPSRHITCEGRGGAYNVNVLHILLEQAGLVECS